MRKVIKTGLFLIILLFLNGNVLKAVPGNKIKLPANIKVLINKTDNRNSKIIKFKKKNLHAELLKSSAELLSRKEFREMLNPWVNDFNHWKSTKRKVE